MLHGAFLQTLGDIGKKNDFSDVTLACGHACVVHELEKSFATTRDYL